MNKCNWNYFILFLGLVHNLKLSGRNSLLRTKMKLTQLLFRRNRLPNGHIFRGKDRLVKKVEPKHLRALERDFNIEEQNMFYLRHPYLTEVSIHT